MTTTRRTFLSVVAAGSAATCLGALGGCAATLTGVHVAGNISDLAEGGTLVVAGQPLVALRDASGVWAMTTICTHLDCDMLEQGDVTTTQLNCDCHGSEFTADGEVMTGPAIQALDNFAVAIDDDGEISIDTDSFVDAGTRTAVATT